MQSVRNQHCNSGVSLNSFSWEFFSRGCSGRKGTIWGLGLRVWGQGSRFEGCVFSVGVRVRVLGSVLRCLGVRGRVLGVGGRGGFLVSTVRFWGRIPAVGEIGNLVIFCFLCEGS